MHVCMHVYMCMCVCAGVRACVCVQVYPACSLRERHYPITQLPSFSVCIEPTVAGAGATSDSGLPPAPNPARSSHMQMNKSQLPGHASRMNILTKCCSG